MSAQHSGREVRKASDLGRYSTKDLRGMLRLATLSSTERKRVEKALRGRS